MTKIRKPLQKPVIPMVYAWEMLSGARHKGLDMAQLAQGAGIAGQALEQQQGLITIDQYARLMEQARNGLDDEFIGFLATRIPPKSFATWCYALAGCQNPAEALAFSNQFIALFSDQVRWHWQVQGEDAYLRLHFSDTQAVDSRFSIQSLLLVPIRLLGWLIGESVQVMQTSFTFADDGRQSYDRFGFGSDILYSQTENWVRFPAAVVNSRIRCNHQQITTLLHDTRGLFLFRQDLKPYSRSVRRMLLEHQEQGWLPLSDIAAAINLTEQTLWRKLKKEGSSYSTIREGIKLDWAKQLLSDPDKSISEVALEMEFSESSSFHKAFKKWTGLTPSEYRHALMRNP